MWAGLALVANYTELIHLAYIIIILYTCSLAGDYNYHFLCIQVHIAKVRKPAKANHSLFMANIYPIIIFNDSNVNTQPPCLNSVLEETL